MRRIQQIFLLCVLCATINFGQRVYFTESYTEKGEPIGAKNDWDINPWGSYIFIMLESESQPIPGKTIYLYIDKKEKDSFQPFDSKSIGLEPNQKWAVYNYKFTEEGLYDVYFITSDQRRFAGENIKIKLNDSISKQKANQNRVYFEDCKVLFSKQILFGGKTLGETKSMSISENAGTIFIKINNQKPLNTSKLLLDIWRKKNRSFEYDEFIESKKFAVNPKWMDTYFKYLFKQPGEYKFSIYGENEVMIVTGYFSVTK